MTLPWDTFQPLGRKASTTPASSARAASDAGGVVVIGAGLAGCWAARLLVERAIPVCIIDRHGRAGSGASGNPAGIVKPYVTRSPCLAMSFHQLAHHYLVEQLRQLQLTASSGFRSCGVLQLVQRAYPESASYTSLDDVSSGERAGLPVRSRTIEFADSGWLNPAALCQLLLDHPLITRYFGREVSSLNKDTDHADDKSGRLWNIELRDDRTIQAAQLILACGEATNLIPAAQQLPLIPARGQISRFALTEGVKPPQCIVNGKHYVIPDGKSVLVGATFTRDSLDSTVRDEDHALNLAGVQQLLPELSIKSAALAGYAGIRATTPDRLPVVGPLPDFATAATVYRDLRHGRVNSQYPTLPVVEDVYIIGGLGSRGVVTAPLCAALVADLITGVSATLSQHASTHRRPVSPTFSNLTGGWSDWAPLVNPVRFLIRNLKRGVAHQNGQC